MFKQLKGIKRCMQMVLMGISLRGINVLASGLGESDAESILEAIKPILRIYTFSISLLAFLIIGVLIMWAAFDESKRVIAMIGVPIALIGYVIIVFAPRIAILLGWNPAF